MRRHPMTIRFAIRVLLITMLAIIRPAYGQYSPKYEMRGLWVATVKNIDWPSKPGLPVEEQKKEAIRILDKAQSLNFNAIFLQVRPTSDAFYQSSFEPWSIYLTGTSGKTPQPFYDPLAFWIEQAHARQLELHAWINPYRANMSVNEPMSPTHPVNQNPKWFVTYNGRHQYDPGIPSCRRHIVNVVRELVQNYNLDGIHMDDYFYPYPKEGETFADTMSFRLYNPKNYLPFQKNDWRRENVDTTIAMLSQVIRQTKPHISFGISPFGVWRNRSDDPNGSDTRAGITNYDHLHADIIKWLKENWIDYVAPQIYWDQNHKSAGFNTLIHWWAANSCQKPLFVGHALYRLNKEAAPWDTPKELLSQINISRNTQGVSGSIHFSANHLFRELKGFQDSLIIGQYKHKALVPAMTAIQPPQSDPVELKRMWQGVKWDTPTDIDHNTRFVIYAYKATSQDPLNNGANIVGITRERQISLKDLKLPPGIWYMKVSMLNRSNQEWGTSLPLRLMVRQ